MPRNHSIRISLTIHVHLQLLYNAQAFPQAVHRDFAEVPKSCTNLLEFNQHVEATVTCWIATVMSDGSRDVSKVGILRTMVV